MKEVAQLLNDMVTQGVNFVMALQVGRAKDFTRILALLENEAVRREEVAELAAQHGLADAWRRFAMRFLDE